ncbi:hypothetical protein ACF0H5_015888 [Mactra antiquata]
MELFSLIETNSPIILVFLSVFLFCYYVLSLKNANYPPGPFKLPFLGNIYFFNNLRNKKLRLHRALMEEAKKYGDIIGFQVFGQKTVFLIGYDAIHDAFVKHSDVTSERPHWLDRLKEATKEGKGVVWQSGHDWKVLRKFMLQTMRDFGVGKTNIEEKIMYEVDAATDYLNTTKAEPTNPRLLTSMIITNVIYGIVFDKRFDFTDKEFHQIIHNLDIMFKTDGGGGPSSLNSLKLSRIFNRQAYHVAVERLEVMKWIKSHIYKEITNHEDTFDNDNIRDFVDLYVQIKQQNSDAKIYNKGNMFRMIMDLFVAGSETTSNTINWCILYMQEYPGIQKKCQDTILESCGERTITWSDRSKLPYIEATLLEIQRLANIAPMSVPHTTEVDITLGGYTIPRRTLIVANLYSANMDTRYWDQPELFNPDRFLENGKLKKTPAFIPFSTGPRMCLGETLARMEMFLVFTNLLQRFTFKREDDNTKHSMESIFVQVTSSPVPYKTRAVKRT